MPSYRTGAVTAVLEERSGLQKVEVDGERAYVLTQLVGTVAVGDRVVLNTTAVELGLGTGGWHVVHWNLAREAWSAPGPGHVMKLRYTSLQVDTGSAEPAWRADAEVPPAGPEEDLGGILGGRPVVACDLHSQVACVAAAFGSSAPGRRLAFVMTDWAALPMAMSDLVAALVDRGMLAATVTCGQAFGGGYEAVSLASGLQVAVAVAGADAVVVGPGPGAIGSGSALGYGGVGVAGVVDVAARLGGLAVVAVRYSRSDPRPRHRGVSHHTATALHLASATPLVPVPRGADRGALVEVVEVDLPSGPVLDAGLGVTTMGRGPQDDPEPFRYAAAAGVLAAQLAG